MTEIKKKTFYSQTSKQGFLTLKTEQVDARFDEDSSKYTEFNLITSVFIVIFGFVVE